MFCTFFQPISSAAGRVICAAACTICSTVSKIIFLLINAMVLTACSPGTGGTGTGPIASSATPVIYAAGSFESSSLPAGSTTVFSSAAAGSAASSVSNPCAAPCPVSTSASATSSTTATLQLEANSIQLATQCSRFTSTRAWSISAAGELIAQGNYETSATINGSSSTNAQNATLSLSFGSAGIASSSASASVKDSAGKPLLGPLVLTRGGAGVGAAGALAFGAGC